jgi:DNA-binding NarL/FixJ family response regulator
MCKQYRFLLIGTSAGDPWRQIIATASASLGILEIAGETDLPGMVQQQDYEVVIIDAGGVDDISCLISSFKSQKPPPKVVVVTMSPTWKRAREVFLAGATDYIRKSMSLEEVLSTLKAVVDKTPSKGC